MNHIVAEQTSEEGGNRKKERHKVVKEPQQGQQLLLKSLASQLRTEIKQEMISWVRQSTAISCNISFYNKVPNFHLLLLFLFSTDSQLSDNNLNFHVYGGVAGTGALKILALPSRLPCYVFCICMLTKQEVATPELIHNVSGQT